MEHQQIKALIDLAAWLDSRFRLPGTTWRFGLDGVLGLIPVVGDAATTVLSGYLVWQAHRLGIPKHLLARMVGNILLDALVGSVPLVGDLFDFAWKANSKNIAILQEHLRNQREAG